MLSKNKPNVIFPHSSLSYKKISVFFSLLITCRNLQTFFQQKPLNLDGNPTFIVTFLKASNHPLDKHFNHFPHIYTVMKNLPVITFYIFYNLSNADTSNFIWVSAKKTYSENWLHFELKMDKWIWSFCILRVIVESLNKINKA